MNGRLGRIGALGHCAGDFHADDSVHRDETGGALVPYVGATLGASNVLLYVHFVAVVIARSERIIADGEH